MAFILGWMVSMCGAKPGTPACTQVHTLWWHTLLVSAGVATGTVARANPISTSWEMMAGASLRPSLLCARGEGCWNIRQIPTHGRPSALSVRPGPVDGCPQATGLGMTCCVYQGHYGHFSAKPTWLYAVRTCLPPLKWGKPPQCLPQWMVDRYGYEKARRIGVMAMVGGKDKTRIRNATPEPFRDVLLAMVRPVQETQE